MQATPTTDGRTPTDEPIAEGTPTAYLCTLPIKQMKDAAMQNGIDSAISNTAGTYVCNSVLYNALH